MEYAEHHQDSCQHNVGIGTGTADTHHLLGLGLRLANHYNILCAWCGMVCGVLCGVWYGVWFGVRGVWFSACVCVHNVCRVCSVCGV